MAGLFSVIEELSEDGEFKIVDDGLISEAGVAVLYFYSQDFEHLVVLRKGEELYCFSNHLSHDYPDSGLEDIKKKVLEQFRVV